MNISEISKLASKTMVDSFQSNIEKNEGTQTPFEHIFQSALNMVNETNSLTMQAEQEEIKFAAGESESPLDLMIAQQKANYSIQYTVAVRNAVLDAYKEIMNLQF